jgi:signal transduction histidine kinase
MSTRQRESAQASATAEPGAETGPTGPGVEARPAEPETGSTTTRDASLRELVIHASGNGLAAVERLAGGLGTAVLGLFVLAWLLVTAVACLVGVGLFLAPVALRALHAVAERERNRLTRWGPELIGPDPAPTRLREALVDTTTRRELRWLVRHSTVGLLLGLIGVLLAVCTFRDITFPLWWRLAPDGVTSTSVGLGQADTWLDVVPVVMLAVGWIAIIVGLGPGMAELQANAGRRLLAAGSETDLTLRVAELTATRAAALDAHSTELRRIERALHDGTQNRFVNVTVLLGAARRMVARDPAGAEELLERAQTAAEQALADLRSVVRGILPPVVTDRGLAGALDGLATSCPVPCSIDVDVPVRCAASVEATAYFVVAEALTNVSKHSHASSVTVTARSAAGRLRISVTDDGRGGAGGTLEGEASGGGSGGSGLVGIRRRVAAHDGTLNVTSPVGGPTILEVELPCGS